MITAERDRQIALVDNTPHPFLDEQPRVAARQRQVTIVGHRVFR